MKTSQIRRKTLLALGVVLPMCILPGCATLGAPANDSAVLMERATAYWTALKANDNITAWSYEDVSKDPAWTLQAYLQRGGLVYEKADPKQVISVDGDKAVVDVAIQYSVPMARLKSQQSQAKDSWKKIDGQWYHELSRGAMFDKP